MALGEVATIGAVTLALVAIIGRCVCDFWRIGCCCGKVNDGNVYNEDNKDKDNDGYKPIN